MKMELSIKSEITNSGKDSPFNTIEVIHGLKTIYSSRPERFILSMLACLLVAKILISCGIYVWASLFVDGRGTEKNLLLTD